MTQDGQRRTRRLLLVNLLWSASLLLFPVLYVASYPMAVRRTGSFHLPAYTPVEWLIDNTALAQPIYRWADCCGAGGDVEWAAEKRAMDRALNDMFPGRGR